MDRRITAAQLRGARAMLGWSLADLACAAGTSVATVHRAEGRRSGPVEIGILGAIRVALETAGVGFLDMNDDGVGLTFSPAVARLNLT